MDTNELQLREPFRSITNSTANCGDTLSRVPLKRLDTDKRVRLHVNNSGSGGRFGVALPAALMAQ